MGVLVVEDILEPREVGDVDRPSDEHGSVRIADQPGAERLEPTNRVHERSFASLAAPRRPSM